MPGPALDSLAGFRTATLEDGGFPRRIKLSPQSRKSLGQTTPWYKILGFDGDLVDVERLIG